MNENNTEIRWIYLTASDADEARRIGRALVEERLAACVNIIGSIESLYWWEGAVQEDREAALIAKTTADRVPELIARVQALHSYENPCLVALPILEGSAPFLEWIRKETRDAGNRI